MSLDLDQVMASWRRELREQDHRREMVEAVRGGSAVPEVTERRETVLATTPFVPLAQDEPVPVDSPQPDFCCPYHWPPPSDRVADDSGASVTNTFRPHDCPDELKYQNDTLIHSSGTYNFVGKTYQLLLGDSAWEIRAADNSLVAALPCLLTGGVTDQFADSYSMTAYYESGFPYHVHLTGETVTIHRVSRCTWIGKDSNGNLWGITSDDAGAPISQGGAYGNRLATSSIFVPASAFPANSGVTDSTASTSGYKLDGNNVPTGRYGYKPLNEENDSGQNYCVVS